MKKLWQRKKVKTKHSDIWEFNCKQLQGIKKCNTVRLLIKKKKKKLYTDHKLNPNVSKEKQTNGHNPHSYVELANRRQSWVAIKGKPFWNFWENYAQKQTQTMKL